MALLTATACTQRYGATLALDAVDLAVLRGEIHAVVGENGAGKSTLVRLLAGALRPDHGMVQRAAQVRVGWVPQEPDLPTDCTAAEWIFLGEELRGPLRWMRRAAMHVAAASALAAVGSRMTPDTRLGELTASQRKQVQLARAVRQAADVWLLDEPTAVLGDTDALHVFALARALAARGGAVVWVSHRLDEVLRLADRITVLRDGRRVASGPARDFDVATLVRRMVGRDVPAPARVPARPAATVLRVDQLAVGPLRGLSLDVQAGEIVGVAGLVGAGRSALLEAIAGLRRYHGAIDPPPARAGAYAVLLPEDRQRKGLVPTLGLRENIFLPADGWRLRHGAERRDAAAWVARLALRTPGIDAPIDALSGGNQQKALLARALRRAPRLLLLDEPTAGVDVGAKADIHAHIRDLAARGTAVLLASSELSELLSLCNRTLALYGGRVAGTVAGTEANETALGALITGQSIAVRQISSASPDTGHLTPDT